MSTSATDPTKESSAAATEQVADASPKDKGKGKVKPEDAMDEDEEEEEEEDDEDEDEEDEEDEEEEEDGMEEIDATTILARRTRGKKVDYTSEEALNKAGLKKEDMETDE
ncbi:hypothetical protein K435DRAFT_970591 [Dendrothele bispora CBS 962.96]|uniref:Histone chaperone domain-containing protein n=1 Tax=Dendrothele bispora (strain CBS 962.96) TaxID=1314807 RepID=A0A4S8LA78_DENBC|nr:hypothetical protein K435DRAFT_970591 [Dendrothele bispora CBS 962.96]